MKEFKKGEPPARAPHEPAREAAGVAPGPDSLRSVIDGLQQTHGNAYVQRLVAGLEGGQPLDPAAQARLEPVLGAPLDGVRVHADAPAASEAERLGARAFTQGEDIYFGPGEYAPATEEGRALLAHELAHVVQQRRGGAPAPSGALEAEAQAAEAQAGTGGRAAIAHSAAPSVQRKEKKEEPSVARHPVEITPMPPSGVFSAAGRFTIAYTFSAGDPVMLTLQVPAGVSVAVTPLDIGGGEFRVNDPGGTGARSVAITVAPGGPKPVRVQVAFVQGSATYLVIFQFVKPALPVTHEAPEGE